MTKLGELLKSEREKRNLSLHEIGMSLKINPKILKAIEEGDPANLPAKTFLRGFVKSYAQYLRLDVNAALDLFQEEYGSSRPEVPTPTTTPSTSSTQTLQQPSSSGPKFETSLRRPDDVALPTNGNNRIYTIIFAVILLLAIAFVAKVVDKYQKEARDEKSEMAGSPEASTTRVTPPPVGTEGGSATPLDTNASTTTTLAPPQTEQTVTDSSQAAALPGPISTSTTTSTTLKPQTPLVTSAPTPSSSMTSTTTTTTTTSTLAGATPTTTTLKPAIVEVIVEALNRVTIRFSLNGGQKWEVLELNPDQVHTFRSRIGVQLEVTDGGAVNVIVNGRDRGVPGTIGRPLRLNFP